MIKKLGKAALVLALGLLSACSGDSSTPTEPGAGPFTSSGTSAPASQTFELRPGETARLNGQVEVTFVRVLKDFRCPIEAFCPDLGYVEAEIAVRHPSGTSSLTLRYEGQAEDQQPGSAGSYLFTMEQVLPAATSVREIQPQEYQVTFSATRR